MERRGMQPLLWFAVALLCAPGLAAELREVADVAVVTTDLVCLLEQQTVWGKRGCSWRRPHRLRLRMA